MVFTKCWVQKLFYKIGKAVKTSNLLSVSMWMHKRVFVCACIMCFVCARARVCIRACVFMCERAGQRRSKLLHVAPRVVKMCLIYY